MDCARGDGVQAAEIFIFEQMWMSEKGCGDTTEAVWKENYEVLGEQKLLKKFDNCGKKNWLQRARIVSRMLGRSLRKKKLLAKVEQLAFNGGSEHC